MTLLFKPVQNFEKKLSLNKNVVNQSLLDCFSFFSPKMSVVPHSDELRFISSNFGVTTILPADGLQYYCEFTC